ncbi:Ribosome biogenesis GTPase Der [Candidatus Hepatincolaceae symbiont of Richtersius coronifer]
MFKIAIVGRPNVGKSTLFNFLTGKETALTDPTPGLTRDRKEGLASIYDINFLFIDTGGYEESEDIINKKIWDQAQIAIAQANCVLFLLDGKAGLSPMDFFLSDFIRKSNKPAIICVNKLDTKEAKANLSLFHELGGENIIPISAAHRMGLNELYYSIKPYYEDYKLTNAVDEVSLKPEMMLAFVGKPNVGKSTIVNTLLNEERLITNNEAGTTRDSIYIDMYYKDKKIKLVDTAGLRRRSKVDPGIEKMANSDSITAINFANVVALIISAEEGLTKQDLVLAKHIVEEGRALIIVINKIDLVKNKKAFLSEVGEQIEMAFFQIKQPYVIGLSALMDKNINTILEDALDLYKKWQFKIPTSKLNFWIQDVLEQTQPPSIDGRSLKIKYVSQVKSRPPTINLWSNQKEKFPMSYLRYIQNELYKAFDLWGCTIRFNIQKSENPYEGKKDTEKKNIDKASTALKKEVKLSKKNAEIHRDKKKVARKKTNVLTIDEQTQNYIDQYSQENYKSASTQSSDKSTSAKPKRIYKTKGNTSTKLVKVKKGPEHKKNAGRKRSIKGPNNYH